MDAVLGEYPVKARGVRSLQVASTRYGLVISAQSAGDLSPRPTLAQLEKVRAIDFGPEDPITLDHLARCLPGQRFTRLRRHYASSTSGILEWVLAGGGFSALPEHVIAPHLALGTLQRLFPDITTDRPVFWSVLEGETSPVLRQIELRLQSTMGAPQS